MIMINVQKMIKEERKKEDNKRKDNLDLCVDELKKIVDKINDEIGMLHRQFDKMAVQISSLVKENYTKELLVKEI